MSLTIEIEIPDLDNLASVLEAIATLIKGGEPDGAELLMDGSIRVSTPHAVAFVSLDDA
jgi:hypothetical protein